MTEYYPENVGDYLKKKMKLLKKLSSGKLKNKRPMSVDELNAIKQMAEIEL